MIFLDYSKTDHSLGSNSSGTLVTLGARSLVVPQFISGGGVGAIRLELGSALIFARMIEATGSFPATNQRLFSGSMVGNTGQSVTFSNGNNGTIVVAIHVFRLPEL